MCLIVYLRVGVGICSIRSRGHSRDSYSYSVLSYQQQSSVGDEGVGVDEVDGDEEFGNQNRLMKLIPQRKQRE